MNILVLCTGNSARSILLEAILNRLGRARGITAYSAGSRPAGAVHPQSLRLLTAKGYDTTGLRSKSWDEFAGTSSPQMDMVITVCGSAAGEACPVWPGTPLRAHWGVEDPAAAAPADQQEAFEAAHARLYRRAEAFVALEPGRLSRAALQTELSRVGTIE
ncbi:arsenate reductase ArsC [Frigidibacter sp. RF13]|uniref:arsenate reductase ArsC n=1 Tax=Frigidibacter sp. RF13 TaxID=2997340 RepID=UPI00227041B9|nr:arsenate reductase ArsC [Frigidibacter sp. RF13]MCY1125575.1 arsenate reductase ArsC [Frigidibacter sp. RF13]